MSNLYITEQGAVLRKTGDRLIVQKDDEILLDVPCIKIKAVLLFGNVQFTTQAVHELFQHGIELAILTRTGRLAGQITSPVTKNIELRIEQFEKYRDVPFRLHLSRVIVGGKIKNHINLLRTFSYNHPESYQSEALDGMKHSLSQIDGAKSLDALMGIEGNGARVYFGHFERMILGPFEFPGRKKHPSTDPVNALLSFGYTLFFNEIASLLDGLGFDPYLGYFHSTEYGRKSLASDLVEEFRASVDRFTLYLVNNRILSTDDFYTNPKGGGTYLTRAAMRRYFAEYERNINREFADAETGTATTLRKSFRSQAEKLARCIKGTADYTTFHSEV